MSSITLKSKIELDLQSIIDGIASLKTDELEDFATEVNNMLAHRRAPALTEKETQLLLTINRSVSPDIQKRYKSLIERSEQELLTDEEQKEYVKLAAIFEDIDATRLQSLVELAQLRGKSLYDLLQQLDINLTVDG